MPLSPAARAREMRERARARARDLAMARSGPPPETGERFAEEACRRILNDLASSGLLRYLVPAPWGETPVVEVGPIAAIREELAWASGLLDVLFVMQGLGSFPITFAGSGEQKTRWLPEVVSGRAVCAFAVTEPGAGSDVGAIGTTARLDGGDYVLDGGKTFISNAPFADLFTVIARTGPEPGRRGLTALVVERETAGLSSAPIALASPHPIGSVVFSGCRVPVKNRLGADGEGFNVVMRTLDRFRPTVGAAAVGFARRALEAAIEFAKTRVQFGRPIAELEGIQFKLAGMATQLDAARLLVERAADSIDRAGSRETASFPLSPLGEDPSREASMAKLFATEAAQEIVDEALQIHGAVGLVRGSVVEALYREVRALRIYEGTSEIQRTIIGRSLVER